MGRDRTEITVLTGDLDVHPAVIAWRRVQPSEKAPTSIDVLKPAKRKSAVYRLHGIGPGEGAVIAKLARRDVVDLEVMLYGEVLPALSVVTVTLHGRVDAGRDSWVFLEDAGDVCYDPNRVEDRSLAVNWLGHLHSQPLPGTVRLPGAGSDYFLSVLFDARTGMRNALTLPSMSTLGADTIHRILSRLEAAELAWKNVEAICAGMPTVLVHGDFVAKNVRLCERDGHLRLVVLDWETAGIGPPAADVALLPGGQKEQEEYWAIVKRTWPRLTLADVQRMKQIGELFRLLHGVSWATHSFVDPWIDGGLRKLSFYRDRLERAPILLDCCRGA